MFTIDEFQLITLVINQTFNTKLNKNKPNIKENIQKERAITAWKQLQLIKLLDALLAK